MSKKNLSSSKPSGSSEQPKGQGQISPDGGLELRPALLVLRLAVQSAKQIMYTLDCKYFSGFWALIGDIKKLISPILPKPFHI
ncbi:unnamed protein product [Protopolystoma xenopodis]|uniref:Uncharacterized protein n=1 Tax=Protopolystoma xenopodis TaxID=117903 RepID=A0A3S5AS09_9PLAT|nr:unnamed protein product [Protopolystoma xenopodis]